jgi:hypothetical protein
MFSDLQSKCLKGMADERTKYPDAPTVDEQVKAILDEMTWRKIRK